MSSSEASLDALRQDIDEIDAAIHDLVMRRCEVVERIAEIKNSGMGARIAIRPAREASILRRLASRHSGRFPLAVLIRMWREMVAGFTQLQGPYAVSVYAPEGQRGLWDVARDHYGSTTPTTAVSVPIAAVRAVIDGTATVAVIPWPDDQAPDPWWPMLMSADAKTPHVIARLPFIRSARGEEREALAVAQAPHEPTGDDHTLVGVELAEPVSRGRLKEAFEAVGLDTVAFWSAGTRNGSNGQLHLVEVCEFIAADDPRLTRMAERLGTAGARSRPIGGFAMPIVRNDHGG